VTVFLPSVVVVVDLRMTLLGALPAVIRAMRRRWFLAHVRDGRA